MKQRHRYRKRNNGNTTDSAPTRGMADMPSGEDLKIIQKIVEILAPELKCQEQASRPMGSRWLVRCAATQLQTALAWEASRRL